MLKLTNRYRLAVAALLFTFYGCKKIIDVNLKEEPGKTVITGEINNKRGPYKIKISKTVSFTAANNYPAVSGAFVIITRDGRADTLTESMAGVYLTHSTVGIPGSRYTLKVTVEGKVFTATSVMPQAVPIDSIGLMSGRYDNIFPVVYFKDPPGEANYYQFIEYVDGIKLSNGRGNAVFDDRLSDGRYISRILYDDSTDIKPGVKVTVQMNSVDRAVFDYLNELFQVSGGGNGGFSSPTPANPTTNLTGGAIGYFSANTIAAKSIMVR